MSIFVTDNLNNLFALKANTYYTYKSGVEKTLLLYVKLTKAHSLSFR